MHIQPTTHIHARRFFLGFLLLLSALTASAADYGPWNKWDAWKGFEYRLRREKEANNGRYTWWIQVRNNYQKQAHLNVDMTRPGDPMRSGGRLDIRPGGTDEYWTLVGDPTRITCWIVKVRFGEDSGPYAKPDDKD